MTGFDSDAGAAARAWSQRLANVARAATGLARKALPQACALCAAPAHTLVCADCDRTLPRIPEACPRCALPMPGGALCGACLAVPPPCIVARAAFAYAFPVDRLLQRLKFGGALALADWAAQALADTIRGGAGIGEAAPMVAAVPLSRERQRERGFNQAQEIARLVAATLDLPMAPLLERVRGGPPQSTLPWRGRARNVRGAFASGPRAAGLHIALVDDVMTTGATLHEATRVLLDAGARSVALWVVARTLPPDEA